MTENVAVVSWEPVESERRPSKKKPSSTLAPVSGPPSDWCSAPTRRTTASAHWPRVKTLGQWETSSQLSSAGTVEWIHDMQESGIMRSKNKHDYIFEVLFSINMHAAFSFFFFFF